MAETMTIKATWIKGRRSRGRAATSTRTVMREVRADAHPAEIMHVMSLLFPLLLHVPAWYQVRGVRYELLRIESRTENGARVKRAVFKDERAIRKSFAREMRRRHRAARRSAERAIRAEARRRAAMAIAMMTRARVGAMLATAFTARYRRLAVARLAARVPAAAFPSQLPITIQQISFKDQADLAT